MPGLVPVTRAVTAVLCLVCAAPCARPAPVTPAPVTPPAADKPARDPFLDEVQRRAFRFFWDETDPITGLTRDRAGNFAKDTYNVASIAATGFALTAYCIGAERGWVSRDAADRRVLTTLRWLSQSKDVRHGLFPHFITFGTGERAWTSEYSTIDTTLLLAGALTAGEYFGGEARTLANRLYGKVDWKYWSPRGPVSHGSRPEEGEFLEADYSGYSEALLLYILAIGSPTHPVPADRWHTLGRWIARYGPYSSIAGPSLFVNQYPILWVDFRGKHDRVADYFENTRANTLANRLYCINQQARYPWFGPNVWGLTAGDGPGNTYHAWGAEPGGAHTDGAINPHAAGGSYMVTPVESRRALAEMLARYRPKLWGRYGFSDGFNPGKDWYDEDVIGIDTGATLLSIENSRTGFVNRVFMRHPAVRKAMRRIGFTPVPRPKGTEPFRVSGVLGLEPGAPRRVSFTLPDRRAAWAKRQLFLYGGVIEERTVRVNLNGRALGTAAVPRGLARAAAFPVPADRLLWGRVNTLTITLEAAKAAPYGPLFLGPREGLEWKPLAIVPNAHPVRSGDGHTGVER